MNGNIGMLKVYEVYNVHASGVYACVPTAAYGSDGACRGGRLEGLMITSVYNIGLAVIEARR